VDDNKPAVPVVGNPTPTPTPAPQPVSPIGTVPEQKSSSKMLMWLVGGVVLVILVVGGIYFYLNSQQKAALTTTDQKPSIPKVEENLENDINSVDIGDLDKEFSTVDKDLQSL
jgi:cytoskeletal protein RodZ